MTTTSPGSALLSVVGSSRPISWVNTAFPFGAAYLLAGGGTDLAFWLGCFFFLVPYNLLMYGLNDVFDYESDLRNPRKGGIEGVVLGRGLHRATIVAAVSVAKRWPWEISPTTAVSASWTSAS